jgi:hypothetical protein
MNLSEFKILCSNKQDWKLSISHRELKWKFTCGSYQVYSDNVAIKSTVVGENSYTRWYLVGNGYLNFTEDSVIFSDSQSDIDENILTNLNVLILYNKNVIFPKQTFI